MKHLLFTLVVIALAGAPSRVGASCRSFGTQLDCAFGNGRLSIGTQTAAAPRHAGTLAVQPLHGESGLFDSRLAGGWPLRVELQNVGADRGLCWTFGDETYCH